MKTKFKIKVLIIFLILLSTNIKAETILFDSKNIKIEQEGNMIFATKGIAKIPSKNLEIEGDKFIYDKLNSELTVFDNVKYFDNENNIIIESEKLLYNELKNILFSQSETYINVENKYHINSTNVLFDRNQNKISSNKFSKINDNRENIFEFKNGLIFNTVEEIISSLNIKIIEAPYSEEWGGYICTFEDIDENIIQFIQIN